MSQMRPSSTFLKVIRVKLLVGLLAWLQPSIAYAGTLISTRMETIDADCAVVKIDLTETGPSGTMPSKKNKENRYKKEPPAWSIGQQ